MKVSVDMPISKQRIDAFPHPQDGDKVMGSFFLQVDPLDPRVLNGAPNTSHMADFAKHLQKQPQVNTPPSLLADAL